jgi:ABC-type branched-subunit amino acid transport system ATPase component
MTSAPARLAASDVTVRFGGLVALHEVSITVPPATIVGLVGPNGAGKSTLFAALSGLRRPNSGQVWINGEEVTNASPQKRAALGLARTFQHPELFVGLTVREHLVLAHRVRHTPRRLVTDLLTFGGFRPNPKSESAAIDALLEELGLTSIAHRPALGLPLGQARLVEIGRALAREPSVLLLDEASSGLDAAETEALVPVLRRLVDQRGVSLLLVEHDVELVLNVCARVTVLDFGICIADGTPQEIQGNAAVRAAYLGEESDPTKESA